MRLIERYRADPLEIFELRLQCSFIGTAAALIGAGIAAAAGGTASAVIGSKAAKSAAQTQADSAEQSLDFQKQVYGDQKQNQQPFVEAGQYSIQKLMDSLKNGTFGPGSIVTPGQFHAPTLADVQNEPGYQFTKQQGEQGIERGAAAAGGAFTGGTLKALAGFDTNLADSTYGSVFNRALQTYGTTIQDYQNKLAGQSQAFGQLASVASAGQGAIQSINGSGTAAANNVGNLLTQSGNARAAGIVGGANAITGGIQNGINGATLPLYLQYLNPQAKPGGQINYSDPNLNDAMKYSYTGPNGVTNGLDPNLYAGGG